MERKARHVPFWLYSGFSDTSGVFKEVVLPRTHLAREFEAVAGRGKLLQVLSSLMVEVILAIFMWASARYFVSCLFSAPVEKGYGKTVNQGFEEMRARRAHCPQC